MKIKLTPVRMDEQLLAIVNGDIIKLNDDELDFTYISEGEVIGLGILEPLSKWISGTITRIDGEIHLTLVLPHGPNAPVETRFPRYYNEPMTIEQGVVPMPPYDEGYPYIGEPELSQPVQEGPEV